MDITKSSRHFASVPQAAVSNRSKKVFILDDLVGGHMHDQRYREAERANRKCFSIPKISSSITSRGTNHSEGSRGNSRVAPTTDSLAGGAPIAPASPSPERGERSPSQEWRQQLASSLLTPSCWARARRSVRPPPALAHRTRCSRSRMACPETDWVGKSRRGPGPPFDSTG